ncbi:MAG: hypothetical protein KGO82_16230 [Bacteroidota bacterium]|nr:hypothetical protein [Bacteroidota bacterium]
MLYFYFLWVELASLAVALIQYPALRKAGLALFIPFLLLTNIVEWGSRYGVFTVHDSNNWVLNIFTLVEFIFYSFLFCHFSHSDRHRSRIKTLTVIIVSVCIANILFGQGLNRFHSYSFLVGSMLMVYFSGYYFFELMKRQDYIRIVLLPSLWIVTGILFFYIGMFCYYIFYETYAYRYFADYYMLFNILGNIFNIALYGCFIVSFLCMRRTTTL